MLSLKAARHVPTSLLGDVARPALLTTSVKLVGQPWATVTLPTSLLGVMLTTLTTVPATALWVAPRLMVVAGTSTVRVRSGVGHPVLVAIAVTSMVTVTVPPEAIVTLPANAPLPETLKLAVLALPLTALATRASVVLKFAGMLSLRRLSACPVRRCSPPA